jgi:hypothetical protein
MQLNLNFSFPRKNGPPTSMIDQRIQRKPVPSFMDIRRNVPGIRAISTGDSDVQEPPRIDEKPKTMKWGAPTWFLLHTLAEKVREEQFDKIRKDLLDIILKICNNLPCPDCANHATQYLNGINFNTIVTKERLKDMLFTFHNAVNKKKGFPSFQYSELNDKYSKANTTNVIQNFMYFYQQRTYSTRVGTTNFHRTNIVNDLKGWFTSNIQCFYP